MATSTINGAPGSAYNGANVYAILLTAGRPNGIASQDVVTNGSFSLKNLAAGSYQIQIKLNNNQLADRSSSDVSKLLNNPVVVADGSSTYQV